MMTDIFTPYADPRLIDLCLCADCGEELTGEYTDDHPQANPEPFCNQCGEFKELEK